MNWRSATASRGAAGWVLVLAGAVVPGLGAAASDAKRELAVCADPSNLPYSNDRLEGFENRIAGLIASDLNATLRYTWNMQRRSFLRRTLHSGACDLVVGLPVGLQGVAQSRPYYASSYVFVTRRERGLQLSGFDDPRLSDLTIGLHAVGADGANPPPASALAQRGIVNRIVGFPVWGEESEESPQGRIIDAVASGKIDVAIVWGPFAGYFARRHGDTLEVRHVVDDPQQPTLPFRYEMSLAVRRGDDALLKELQQVLDRRRPEIQAILKEYGVPLVTMGTPVARLAVGNGPAE
jgi:mxaJ protein